MRLTFKKLEIHNFLSFKDEIVDLSKNNGMTLICGKNNDIPGSKNGTGKSSMWHALLYVLFNQLQYSIKNQNLHNKYVNDPSMTVLVELSIDKSTSYKIVRGFNKNRIAYCSLFVSRNGSEYEDITKSTIAETQKFIESEVLHCDISIFLRTILLSSDQNYNFFRLRPAAKREFIEKLFNISVFANMYSSMHKDILAYDKDITARQNRLMVLNKTESDYLEQIDRFEETKRSKINELNEKISLLTESYQKLKTESMSIEKADVSDLEDNINRLTEAKTKLDAALRGLQKTEFDIKSKIIKAESKIESKKTAIANCSSLLDSLCDKCRPVVDSFYNLDKYRTEIENINKSITDLSASQTEATAKRTEYETKITKIDSKISELTSKIISMTSEANKTNSKLASMESDMTVLTRDLESKQNETNPYSSLYESNHEKIESENKNLEEITTKFRYLKFAENIVSQDTLKKFIIKDLVVLLNSKMKYYLGKLGAKFECIFDENMDTTFMTAGGECDYENFSSGEQMRLMIASSFSFRDFMETRNNFSSNILVLDEFVDSNIDKLALDGIIRILTNIQKTCQQTVYVISHRQGDLDNSVFDTILQVEKTNNISKIVFLESEK